MLHRISLNQIKELMIDYLERECNQFEDADLIRSIHNFSDLSKHINKFWDLEAFFYAIGNDY